MTNEDLQNIRQQMKEHNLTGARIAWSIGRSASWVNNCLKGNVPWYHAGDTGQAYLPRDIVRYLQIYRIDIPTQGTLRE